MPPSVQNVIHSPASRSAAARVLSRLVGVLTGAPGRAGGAVRALQVRIGLAVLGRVKEAFVVKARGGTDEAGDSWQPLSPHTIAYTRRHPGVPKRRPFWQTHPSFSVTARQRDEWWAIYRRYKNVYGGDKSHAAATAWVILRTKYPGIRTLMDRYGKTRVEILRDTGVLLNSLSPGVPADVAPDSPPPVPRQAFRTLPGVVTIGTNRKGAAANHRGIPGRLPQRRLWPHPRSWPASWWADALEQAVKGTILVVRRLLGAA